MRSKAQYKYARNKPERIQKNYQCIFNFLTFGDIGFLCFLP